MKKLAIVGTASSSIHLAPYNNDDYEIWALNGVNTGVDFPNIKNFTRWFDIHSWQIMKDYSGLDFYKSLTIPIYMQDAFPELPASVKYPLEEIVRKFPRAYFTNTVSYMLALAIYEGYVDISIYGVDMQLGSEYSDQRPSCEYFIGYAEGAGINIYLPPESDLLKCAYLYGFEEEKQNLMKAKINARIEELKRRKESYEVQADNAAIAVHQLEGAIQDAQYLLGVWL